MLLLLLLEYNLWILNRIIQDVNIWIISGCEPFPCSINFFIRKAHQLWSDT